MIEDAEGDQDEPPGQQMPLVFTVHALNSPFMDVLRASPPPRFTFGQLQERLEQVDRDREERRRVVLRGDLVERLEVPELKRHGLRLHERRRFDQLLGGLELPLRVDDLGPPFPLRLRLLGDRALHLLRQIDLLHLDE